MKQIDELEETEAWFDMEEEEFDQQHGDIIEIESQERLAELMKVSESSFDDITSNQKFPIVKVF